jgi:hypothetical protein
MVETWFSSMLKQCVGRYTRVCISIPRTGDWLASLATYPPPGQSPCASAPILTHILQPEVKSKMSALKQGLQREPAFPDGSPARRTIMAACQIATQACDLRPEGPHRHGRRRVTSALGQHCQHHRINDRRRRTLWFGTRAGTSLQQAHGKRRQQTRASASGRQRGALAVAQCDSHL